MVRPVHAAEVVLGRNFLYMLPTRLGIMFTVALLAMLMAAVNYQNSLAYMFTFMLGSMVIVSMLFTHRNLAGVQVRGGNCEPVLAGQTAEFQVWLDNPGDRSRPGVQITCEGREVTRVDVPANQKVCVTIPVVTEQRGYLAIPAIVVSTQFPIGLLFTWSREIVLPLQCLVYPAPGPERPFQMTPDRRRYQEMGQQPEGDDFAGLREYRHGDSPRHVHWKAVARGQGMYTKQFAGAGQDVVWLDWQALEGLETEPRLSQLCRWVLDAERQGLHYGLRLPGSEIEPARGENHQHQCLAALATF
jgi:uncharacterized protein (DUF58 family)